MACQILVKFSLMSGYAIHAERIIFFGSFARSVAFPAIPSTYSFNRIPMLISPCRAACPDRCLGRGGRHRRLAGFRDQPGLVQPQCDGALSRPQRDRHYSSRAGVGIKITREFCPGDRYTYDFGFCSYENGWAQFDTAQDASYFGTWANPTRLMILSYCKGDTTLKEAASPEEFAAELREVDAWNRAHGYGPARIDPGFDPAMKAAFEKCRVRWGHRDDLEAGAAFGGRFGIGGGWRTDPPAKGSSTVPPCGQTQRKALSQRTGSKIDVADAVAASEAW